MLRGGGMISSPTLAQTVSLSTFFFSPDVYGSCQNRKRHLWLSLSWCVPDLEGVDVKFMEL